MGDVLAVQEQIDSIQSQIEQLQGQLQLLTSQTSYSTLTVTVSEGTPAPSPGPLPESGLVRAWHASIGGFVAGVEGVIRIAGPLLFALLLLRRGPRRRTRPVAALSAPQPVGRSAQAPMAAASGMPGMETTPKPAEGLRSSLTAIGPEACTRIGVESGGRQRGSGHDLHAAGGQRARGQHVVAGRRRGERAVALGTGRGVEQCEVRRGDTADGGIAGSSPAAAPPTRPRATWCSDRPRPRPYRPGATPTNQGCSRSGSRRRRALRSRRSWSHTSRWRGGASRVLVGITHVVPGNTLSVSGANGPDGNRNRTVTASVDSTRVEDIDFEDCLRTPPAPGVSPNRPAGWRHPAPGRGRPRSHPPRPCPGPPTRRPGRSARSRWC